MKRLVHLAGAASVIALLSACANTNMSTGAGSAAAPLAAASAGAMYCYKDRLYSAGGNLNCNWAASTREACSGNTQASSIASSATTGAPVDSNRCSNGNWLVQVTMK
jgi:hypothetical protein